MFVDSPQTQSANCLPTMSVGMYGLVQDTESDIANKLLIPQALLMRRLLETLTNVLYSGQGRFITTVCNLSNKLLNLKTVSVSKKSFIADR